MKKIISILILLLINSLASVPSLAAFVYVPDPDGICTNEPNDPDCQYFIKYQRYPDDYYDRFPHRYRHEGHYRGDNWRGRDHERRHEGGEHRGHEHHPDTKPHHK